MNAIDAINDWTDKLKSLRVAQEKYSDLKEYRTRWSTYWVSKIAEPDMNDVSFCKSCGCCNDAVIYAMPYLKIAGLNVYSEKCQIPIGEALNFSGIKCSPVYKDKFKYFRPEILQKVENYIKQIQETTEED